VGEFSGGRRGRRNLQGAERTERGEGLWGGGIEISREIRPFSLRRFGGSSRALPRAEMRGKALVVRPVLKGETRGGHAGL